MWIANVYIVGFFFVFFYLNIYNMKLYKQYKMLWVSLGEFSLVADSATIKVQYHLTTVASHMIPQGDIGNALKR